jgi:hypothetical protein
MLGKIFSFAPDVKVLWFEYGPVKADVMAASYGGAWINISDISIFLSNIMGMDINFNQTILLSLFTFGVSLFFLMIGIFEKISNVIAIFFHLVFVSTFYHYSYGVDNFITMLLFYLLITKSPMEYQISLSKALFGKPRFDFGFDPQFVLRLIQVHICIIYCFSGFEKALGVNWWNGESIWRAIHNEFGLIDASLIDNIRFKFVFWIAGWATIAIELFYPIFVNIKKTRLLWVSLTIGMHISIIALLGLYHFGAVMILFNLTAFVLPYLYSDKEPGSVSWQKVFDGIGHPWKFTIFRKAAQP